MKAEVKQKCRAYRLNIQQLFNGMLKQERGEKG